MLAVLVKHRCGGHFEFGSCMQQVLEITEHPRVRKDNRDDRDDKLTNSIALITVIPSPSWRMSAYWQNSDLFEGMWMRMCKVFRMPFNSVMHTHAHVHDTCSSWRIQQ